MIVAGFLLLVLSVVVGAGAAYGGQKTAQLDLGFFDVNLSSTAVFFGGVVTTLVALLGLLLMKRGLKAAHQNRKRARQLDKMRGELDRMRKPEPEAESSEPAAEKQDAVKD